MTLTAPSLQALTVLPAAGGFFVPANCPTCGGGWAVEGASRGREDMVPACREIRVSLFCTPCKERYVLLVQLGIATRQTSPEKRWTK